MFLRSTIRRKDGEEHRYWSIVENRRLRGGRVVQRAVLYLGEINSSQERAWRRSIEVLDQTAPAEPQTIALFPEDRCEAEAADQAVVRLRLSRLELRRPRQWGACWLALKLWQELRLDRFLRRPPAGKPQRHALEPDPVRAGRLPADCARQRVVPAPRVVRQERARRPARRRKQALFSHLVDRWRDLFNARFDVLLYDLTRTYFENACLETTVPGIFAAGDIARWPDSHSGDAIRVEHWVVAERQGQIAALNMLGGRERFSAAPFFWSQHYDIPINYVGYAERWDELAVEGSIAGKDCLARFKREGRTLAVASIFRDLQSLEAELSLERNGAP